MRPRPLRPTGHRLPRPPWGWASAGALLGLLIATVVFAPAQWLALAVQAGSGQRLQLLLPQGTVWHGSAQLVLSGGSASQARTALPGRVQWQLRPDLKGLQLALGAPCCLSTDWLWRVKPTWAGVQLHLADQASVWPSALLSGLGTPWNTLQLQGALTLTTQQLSLQWQASGWAVQGQAQLDAAGMTTSLSTLKPLGSYRLNLNGGPSPSLALSTLEGSLQLRGAGHWVRGRLQFEGEASAAPQRTDALANLLNIIGRRDGARSIIKVG